MKLKARPKHLPKQEDGHYKLKLTNPIAVGKLKIGSTVIYSGASMRVKSLQSAKGTSLYVIELTGHPYRRDLVVTMRKADIVFQGVSDTIREE